MKFNVYLIPISRRGNLKRAGRTANLRVPRTRFGHIFGSILLMVLKIVLEGMFRDVLLRWAVHDLRAVG